MYDDYDDDGNWGYNGDSDHDMWVDYTTDMYEDTDYSGENPEADFDWDTDYSAENPEADFDWDAGFADHFDGPFYIPLRSSKPNQSSSYRADDNARMSVRQYEDRIHRLEGVIAAAIASAATLEAKAASAPYVNKKVRKLHRRADDKRSEAAHLQKRLDRLNAGYNLAKLKSEETRTMIIFIICAAVSLMSIVTAVFY